MATSRVVLVTGAAGGIGSQTARRLVDGGHRVALVDIDGAAVERLSTELGDLSLAVRADVTSLNDLEHAVAATVDRFGRLDAVIANAGIEILGPLETMPMADVDRVIQVDLLGVWKTLRAALPQVIRSRGYVLVVSSVSAATPGPFNAAYNAAKAGVSAMARTVRLEVRGRGVRVGVAYFGFEVRNLEAFIERAVAAGATPVAETGIVTMQSGTREVMLRDPDTRAFVLFYEQPR